MKKEKRGTNGITLVALVITIIVLLILAGVTISLVVGDNGIITKAKEAKLNMENAVAEERKEIQSLLNYMNEEKWNQTIVPEETGPNIKEYHNGVPIPKGFYYVGGDSATGLVISDHPADENLGGTSTDITPELQGNQFVWVPVEVTASDTETSIASFKRTTTYNGTITDPGVSYTEPYSKGSLSVDNDLTGEFAEHAEMLKSVYDNHGFYVARYEAGCEMERTNTNMAISQMVLSQKDKYVYDYIHWGKSMEDILPGEPEGSQPTPPTPPRPGTVSSDAVEDFTGTDTEGTQWVGAVSLCRKMYPADSAKYGAVSHLMYGVQFDAILQFVFDSSHKDDNGDLWGNYDNGYQMEYKLKKTGYNEAWKTKNIYDIAGNAYEWTMEAISNSGRVFRGGGNVYPETGLVNAVSARDDALRPYVVCAVNMVSFRPVLYVKNSL